MSDDTLYLYTSLTAGSSHIITATSRIETILKANKIPFKAIDCATDDKARMIWQRRSKGRKLPGLVKYQDVVADLEQIEEWNEYGELKDQIEDIDDIFGDMPVSGSVAEAQAAAAQREAAQNSTSSSQPARQGSEKRHISISEPKKDNPASDLNGKDTPLSMAMRQAGAEAAAKAGQKQTNTVAATKAATSSPTDTATPAPVATEPKLDAQTEEPNAVNTGAKTPAALVEEGAAKSTIEKTPEVESDTSMSNKEQILDQRRKSSVPQARSSLAQTTSIDDAETMQTDDDEQEDTKFDASKVSSTNKEEAKVLQGTKMQEQSATAVESAGDSVGD